LLFLRLVRGMGARSGGEEGMEPAFDAGTAPKLQEGARKPGEEVGLSCVSTFILASLIVEGKDAVGK